MFTHLTRPELYVLFSTIFCATALLAHWSTCRTANHSIPGTLTILNVWIMSGTRFIQPREDNWVAT